MCVWESYRRRSINCIAIKQCLKNLFKKSDSNHILIFSLFLIFSSPLKKVFGNGAKQLYGSHTHKFQGDCRPPS